MIMTLSFANLVCSLSCRLKDHKNSRRSENEETLMKAETIYFKVVET